MRMTALFLGALVALAPMATAQDKQAGAVAAGPKPSIFCDQPTFDFGKITQGKKVDHEFVIENKGTATLKILSVQPTCGCTAALVSENSVAPGKTARIKSTFDSARFEGIVHKTINVSSDDPDNPSFQLEITGTIVKLYETNPGFVDFQRINKNSDFETQVVVRGMEGRKPTITSVTLEGIRPLMPLNPREAAGKQQPIESPFETSFSKKSSSDDYIVTLKLKKDPKPQAISGSLVINLQDPDMPALRLPVRGTITGDVTYFPPRIVFGNMKAKDILPRKVLVTIDNPDVKLQSVDVEPPIFTASTSQRPGPARVTEVQIQLKDGAPAGPVSATLKIHTTSKEQSLISIPVEGTIVQ